MPKIKPEKYYIGDSCLCWSVGSSIDIELSELVLNVYRRLKDITADLRGVRDYVPSYNALAVHYDPLICDIGALEKIVDRLFEEVDGKPPASPSESADIIIPVVYKGEDLEFLAGLHGLSVEEIVDIHKSGFYTVAMVGFKPHFPYLIGLDTRIETPRRKIPRLKVPAGSVAIGGAQTGIYPGESPGGWNLIGRTDPELLKDIKPGDKIQFREVEKI